MAIKIANNTVIDDNRALQNITNLKTVLGNSILGTGDITVTSVPATSITGVILPQNGGFSSARALFFASM